MEAIRPGFEDKIKELKAAVKDPMYLEDMKAVNQDFEYADQEGRE